MVVDGGGEDADGIIQEDDDEKDEYCDESQLGACSYLDWRGASR